MLCCSLVELSKLMVQSGLPACSLWSGPGLPRRPHNYTAHATSDLGPYGTSVKKHRHDWQSHTDSTVFKISTCVEGPNPVLDKSISAGHWVAMGYWVNAVHSLRHKSFRFVRLFVTNKIRRASKENTTSLHSRHALGKPSLTCLPRPWEVGVQHPCLSYGIVIANPLPGAHTVTGAEDGEVEFR